MAIGRSKVVIIGAGNVGTALAHHLVICNTCNNLVLINRNAEKAWAEVTDLNHSVGYYDSNIQISVGTYSDCIDADIVVFDPEKENVISAKTHLYNTDNNPFEGFKLHGDIDSVYLRGTHVVQDGKVIQEKSGKYIKRGRNQL